MPGVRVNSTPPVDSVKVIRFPAAPETLDWTITVSVAVTSMAAVTVAAKPLAGSLMAATSSAAMSTTVPSVLS